MANLYKANKGYMAAIFKGQQGISQARLIGAMACNMAIYCNNGILKNYASGGNGKPLFKKGNMLMLLGYKQSGLQCYALAPMHGISLANGLWHAPASLASFKPILGLAAGSFKFKQIGIGLHAISIRLCNGLCPNIAIYNGPFYGNLIKGA